MGPTLMEEALNNHSTVREARKHGQKMPRKNDFGEVERLRQKEHVLYFTVNGLFKQI